MTTTQPRGNLDGSRAAHDEVDFTTLEGGPWDGKTYSYIPRHQLEIDPSVQLHAEADLEIDPITYQVLRSRFWHVNLEHCDTIKKVSGSPTIVWSDDFNTCILTEVGDTVVSGPSIQYFTGCADLVVKWTLENRGANPGIADGDVFMQNDPYIGAPHQQDTSTYAPVFWDGKLFCWIFSQCHVGDIGGVDPGSFCVNSRDIFDDPLPFPPMKLVRGGVIQNDVAELFVRQSRMPSMIALQLRSQIAGINATRNRFVEALEEYGPAVVKGVMRRMIADCADAVGKRLLAIPDGEWSETVYTASVGPADRHAHRESTSIRKIGDRMICSNAGTDPQALAGNSTYSSWRSALISAASALFASDQRYCPAGVVQHLEFRPTPGTRNVATFPVAISALTSTLVSVNIAYLALSKMLLSGPEHVRLTANAAGGLSAPGWWMSSGLDRNDQFVADATGDSLFGAIGAFAQRDGVDTGGAWWFPRTVAGNAEEWELALPILYLYRKEKRGSGGAGCFRGGNGAEIAITGHKTRDFNVQICSTDPAVNATRGLAGGLPGHSGNHRYVGASTILDALQAGRIPRSIEDIAEMAGPLERVAPKSFLRLLPQDVFIVGYCAGGGVGDPLQRDPRSVSDDIIDGAIDRSRAERQWGVAVDGGGLVDIVETERLRDDMRKVRRDAVPVSAAVQTTRRRAKGAVVRTVAPGIDSVDESDGRYWSCEACGTLLGSTDGNFKLGALVLNADLNDIDPIVYPRIADFCDDDIVLRLYVCPNCVAQLAVDLCRRTDDHSWDYKLT